MSTNEVAMAVLEQLGKRALFMMGAHTFVADADGVMFAVRGSKAVSKVRIQLDAGTDTYTVTFYKGRGLNWKTVREDSMVYVDSLHRVIESTTGLYLSL